MGDFFLLEKEVLFGFVEGGHELIKNLLYKQILLGRTLKRIQGEWIEVVDILGLPYNFSQEKSLLCQTIAILKEHLFWQV